MIIKLTYKNYLFITEKKSILIEYHIFKNEDFKTDFFYSDLPINSIEDLKKVVYKNF